MKRLLTKLLVLIIVTAMPSLASAYDFSAVAPSGQTLYYTILNTTDNRVSVDGPLGFTPSAWDGYAMPTGTLTIPGTVSHGGTTYAVTAVGSYAFYGCSGLTAVTVGDTVTSIGEFAFSHCSGLTAIAIGRNVDTVCGEALSYCVSLASITVDGGNAVYDSRNGSNAIIHTATGVLIAGCRNTMIPNGVTAIGDGAFRGCSGLTAVALPGTVVSIGHNAFRDCGGITGRLVLPAALTHLGHHAFSNCGGITGALSIPDRLTVIGDAAFMNCSGIAAVTIGSTVAHIGDSAFMDCRLAAGALTIPASVTAIDHHAFAD